MNKVTITLLITLSAGLLFFSGCKGKNELQYKSLWGSQWLSGDVVQNGKRVMWFQLFDQIEEKDKAIKSYKDNKKKINGKYPATISDSMIWILINDRIEIRLMADSKNKAYHGKEKLKKFINMFDLAGLEKISGPKAKTDDLKKYCPKLKMVKK